MPSTNNWAVAFVALRQTRRRAQRQRRNFNVSPLLRPQSRGRCSSQREEPVFKGQSLPAFAAGRPARTGDGPTAIG